MAFSTQKDFLTFAFPMNRKKSENQLKTYESCTDTRAWSMDNSKRAKYLAEIVQKMKQMPITGVDGGGDGSRYFSESELEQMSQSELINHIMGLYKNIQSKNNELKATEKLLKDASEKFESIDEVLRENKELRKETQSSKEKIKELERRTADNIQEKMSKELLEKVEQIHDLRTENTNLKSQLNVLRSSVDEISELRRRSEVLDKVTAERKTLTEKMQKMELVEDAIMRLKEKAVLADQLAEENQKLCQVLEMMKKKLQDEASDGSNGPNGHSNAKLEAENRYMKDRLGQVESLGEEIAIYKAENIELHRQINDLRQKIATLRHFETELHQTRELLRRREIELNDCESIIHKCMIKIDQQDRDLKMGAKRMQELRKMQEDLEMIHERVGITYGGNDQEVQVEMNRPEIVEIKANDKADVSKVEESNRKVTNELTGELEKLQKSNENLKSEVEKYQNKIKILEEQLEQCQAKLKTLSKSNEIEKSVGKVTEKPVAKVTEKPVEKAIEKTEGSNSHNECHREILSLKQEIEKYKNIIAEVEQKLKEQDKKILAIKSGNTDPETKLMSQPDATRPEEERETASVVTEKPVEKETEKTVAKVTEEPTEINPSAPSEAKTPMTAKEPGENVISVSPSDPNSHDECHREILSLKQEIEKYKNIKEEVEQKLKEQDEKILAIKSGNTDPETKLMSEPDATRPEEEQETASVETQNLELELSLVQDDPKESSAKSSPDDKANDSENKLSMLQNENEKLRKELAAVKSELEKQVNESLEVSKALKDEIKTLEEGKKSAEKQLKQVTSEKQSLQDQMGEISAVTEKLEQERNKNIPLESQKIKKLEDEVERLKLELKKEIQKNKDTEKVPVPKESVRAKEQEKPLQARMDTTENELLNTSIIQHIDSDENDMSLNKSLIKSPDNIDIESIENRSGILEVIHSQSLDSIHREETIRKSYERDVQVKTQRFDTKVSELQELHDLEKAELKKKHETELDTMRLQIEALENELKKIDDRCKCSSKAPPSIYNTDKRLAKICEDVREFGLEPCLINDLLYLKDLNDKAIMEKKKRLLYGERTEDLEHRLKDIVEDITRNFTDTEDKVRNMKQLTDDEIPVKIPAATKIPLTNLASSELCSMMPKQNKFNRGKKLQNRAQTTPKNTQYTRLNLNNRPASSKNFNTEVLYQHGKKTIKITDKPDANMTKGLKGLRQK